MSDPTEPVVTESLLAKVRALLAKAERTDNAEEADAFNAKAAELMTRYRIERSMLADAQVTVRTIGRINITVEAPYAETKIRLIGAVTRAFDATFVYSSYYDYGRGRKVATAYIFGNSDVLDSIEALYTSLQLQLTRRLVKVVSPWDAADTRLRRRSFIAGFAEGARQKLNEGRQHAVDAAPGAALILATDLQLSRNAMEAVYPPHTLRKTKSRIERRDTAAWLQGVQAGRNAETGLGAVGSGSSRKAIG